MLVTLRRVLMSVALAIAALSGQHPARAQGRDRWAVLATPVFQTYNQDDGLPSPVATSIAEDNDGFIWVGTQGGLARWDGYHFRAYKPASDDGNALPDGLVSALHIDPHGRLWVGMSAGGLAVYDRDHDRFLCFGDGPRGLSNPDVKSIADDGAGGLWIGTDGGLDHLDPATARITSLHHRPGDAGSLPGDHVYALVRDRSGTLWVGTSDGLARLPRASDHFLPMHFGDTRFSTTGVSSLFEDSAGNVWIGTLHDGAFVSRAGSGGDAVPRPVDVNGDGGSALNAQRVFTIAQAAPQEIWLGTYSQGIVAVDMRTGRTRRISRDPLLRQSLPDDSIWALHQDRAGAMWVATNAGLSRLGFAASGAVRTVFSDGSGSGLTAPNILSLAATSDGHVWAGLESGGVDILAPPGGRAGHISTDPAKPGLALPASGVLAFAEWPDHSVYIGTTQGVYHADLAGGSVTRLTIPGRPPMAGARGLFAADGKLWIGGYDDGIWTVMPDGGPRAPVEHFDDGQLTDQRITMLAKGSGGDFWIGSRNGLNRLDLATGRIERILPDRFDPSALAGGFIAGLALDREGRLWVGTMGGGISVLVGREHGQPVFRRIGLQQRLPDDNVDSLLADRAGRIWAATDNGIAVIDPRDFSVQTLHRAEGVAIPAYWDSAAAVTPAGDLLFGGFGGMTVIQPERFHPWDYRPRIVVTEAQIGGRPVDPGRLKTRPGATVEPLLVQPHANRFSFEFAALDYSAPDRNRYAYWLEGFDRDWIETKASRRLAAYMNLPPGRYTLHLRGSNRDGAWTGTTLDIPIRVLPAWFQTTWFKLVSACAALCAVLALIQGRTLYLRRRQRGLEQLVSDRVSDLAESKRQIELIAYCDVLTGLPNRRLFTEELRRLTAAATRQGDDFALLMIDLDHFKLINDTFGHDAGDALLVEAARRMRQSLRISDRLSRLGGDEFAVLATDLSGPAGAPETTGMLCDRIVDCFACSIAFQGQEIKVSVSIGVAICPVCGTSPEAVYKAADLALYEAKHAGRDTWRWTSAPP